MLETHDVVIIGTGAAGGMAAWNLSRQGMNVLMLDAGTKFDRAQFWSHVKPWEAARKMEAGQRPPQFFLDTKEQPYHTLPGQPFESVAVTVKLKVPAAVGVPASDPPGASGTPVGVAPDVTAKEYGDVPPEAVTFCE